MRISSVTRCAGETKTHYDRYSKFKKGKPRESIPHPTFTFLYEILSSITLIGPTVISQRRSRLIRIFIIIAAAQRITLGTAAVVDCRCHYRPFCGDFSKFTSAASAATLAKNDIYQNPIISHKSCKWGVFNRLCVLQHLVPVFQSKTKSNKQHYKFEIIIFASVWFVLVIENLNKNLVKTTL